MTSTAVPQFVTFNAQRHRGGAARQVEQAREALPKLAAAPVDENNWRTADVLNRYCYAVNLRVKYPNATVDQLGAMAGWSKGRYWSILRRALLFADTLPDVAADSELALF
jgi:hypothetical protein